MREQILSATKIKTIADLNNIPEEGIPNAIWKTLYGRVACGELGKCDCGSVFSINCIWVLSGVNTRGWDKLDIEGCSYDHETERCQFCPIPNDD